MYDYVAYKAESEGIEATQVDPAYTSKRCSKCGTTLDENRPSQAKFCCLKCGYEVNADYNAAKNIGFRLLRARQKSPHGGGDTSPRPEVGDIEREGRLLVCRPVESARTGVNRQAHPFRGGLVTSGTTGCSSK